MDSNIIIRNKVEKQVKIISNIIYILNVHNKNISNIKKENVQVIYTNFLSDMSNNISVLIYIDKLESIVRSVSRNQEIKHIKEIRNLMNKFELLKPNIYFDKSINQECDICEDVLIYDIEILKGVCPTCGLCKDIHNSYYGSTTSSLSSPDKRVRECLNDIQGKRSICISEKEWAKIMKKKNEECVSVISSISGRPITRMKVNSVNSCSNIRRWLSSISLSKYNDNVPYIRKLLFGKISYQLTQSEVNLTLYYYNIMNEEYKRLFSEKDKKSSDPHSAYMLGKILEFILEGHKLSILKCIHLQSMKTITARDKKWECVCISTGVMTYKPTLSKYYK